MGNYDKTGMVDKAERWEQERAVRSPKIDTAADYLAAMAVIRSYYAERRYDSSGKTFDLAEWKQLSRLLKATMNYQIANGIGADK